MVMGTPSLTILILGLILFSAYRFWRIGWIAWSGNLRLAAWLAMGLGLAALIFGAMWSFGIRSRKQGVLVFVVGLVALALLQLV